MKRIKNAIKDKLRVWLGVADLSDEVYDAIKDYKHQVERLDNMNLRLNTRISEATDLGYANRNVMSEYFRADVDVEGHRGKSTVVLTGIYRGRGYVQFYDISQDEFGYLVERMRDLHKCRLIRTIDAPPQFIGSFKF